MMDFVGINRSKTLAQYDDKKSEESNQRNIKENSGDKIQFLYLFGTSFSTIKSRDMALNFISSQFRNV